jgi:hypothetical protein
MVIMWLEGLSILKKIHLIGTRSGDLPACSIAPQPTTLQRAHFKCGIGARNYNKETKKSPEIYIKEN